MSTFGRYAVVTAVTTPVGWLAFSVLLTTSGCPAVACNVAAASLVAGPTYVAHNRWVWSQPGVERDTALRYWTVTGINVVIATAAVASVEATHPSRLALTIVPTIAYTAIWAARFVALDRLVFARPRPLS